MSPRDERSWIERCWVWTRRNPTTGEVQRGVMFHDPEASRDYVSVEEYVPASQLRGAVDLARRLAEGAREAQDTGDTRALSTALAEWDDLDASLGGR